ncbi:hypothetical protein KY284_020041 [Solanum tuberosum]|nr:hypothetical protein KY284_020041 [Solanum tuberosum]
MPRNKVKLALIDNESARKVSYKKREKRFFEKAHEPKTLCDAEIDAVIDSPYNNEPTVFPNYDAAINTFVNFKELPTLEKSKNTTKKLLKNDGKKSDGQRRSKKATD